MTYLDELKEIQATLLSKMKEKKYAVAKQERLSQYFNKNLDLHKKQEDMDISNGSISGLFLFNSDLKALFERYCDTAKKINEQSIFEKYNKCLGELKQVVENKRSQAHLSTDHLKMLDTIESVYAYIEEEAKKGPHTQTYMIELMKSMNQMAELKDTNIRSYIGSVSGNTSYVFSPLIPLAASLHMIVPITVVGALNPAITLGIVSICVLALTIALISVSIFLFLHSRRTGFSEQLVTLCDSYEQTRYLDLKDQVILQIRKTNLDEEKEEAIYEILDLIESQTQSSAPSYSTLREMMDLLVKDKHSNTTGYSMLHDLSKILTAAQDDNRSSAEFNKSAPTWRLAYPTISSKTHAFFKQSAEHKSADVSAPLNSRTMDEQSNDQAEGDLNPSSGIPS